MNKKILIATGGGGHFSPALSVIEALPKDIEVLVVGRKHALEGDKALSLEYQTCQQLFIPFRAITAGRLQRKFTAYTVPSLLKMPLGLVQSFKILKEFKPDLVLSFGGYVSLPIVFASARQKIPVVIHEQTLGAGLANKIASKFAHKICISWESSRQFFPKDRTILTGNPVKRVKSEELKIKNENNLPIVFVTGGSAGSHVLNKLIEHVISDLVQNYIVVHQTGDAQEYKDFDKLSLLGDSLPQKLQERYILKKFIAPDEFSSILAKADMVVCRAGMNTISEIISQCKPALMIPLPFSQGDEQLHNAQFVENLKLGKVLAQKNITPESLKEEIDKMIANKKEYEQAGEKAKKLIPKNATENIIKIISEILNDR